MAAAAYRSGEKLHSEYYGEDSDYTRKGGVICSEILMPPHAPPEYANREFLWNAVESVAPLAKVLSETEFYAFAEKAFALPEVKGLLMEAVNEHNKTEFGGD